MITVTVEYLHGVVRANTGEAIAGSSGDTVAEWPPSPARLFNALVAGGGTVNGRHESSTNHVSDDDSELHLLEGATPPLIAADAAEVVRRTEIHPRFVVIDTRADGRVQEYAARKAGLVRPGARVSLRSRFVTFAWPELDPTEKQLNALHRRAARVGYLGCADSPVRIRFNCDSPQDGRTIWRPDDGGTTPVAVPYAGYLDALDNGFRSFLGGESPRAGRVFRARVNYQAENETPKDPEAPILIWLTFDRAVHGRQVRVVGEALQGALLSQFDRADAPAVLHGHDTQQGQQHARFIPLIDAGSDHSRGRLHGAVIWLPATATPLEVGEIRLAASKVGQLRIRDGKPIGVRLREGEGLWSTNPRRWTQPSTTFATVFPAVHERFGKMSDPLTEIGDWCEHAGVPRPVEVLKGREPFVRGAVTLSAREVWRKSTSRYPYSHVWIRFATPLAGPIVLGRGRTHGLGLLVPTNEERTSKTSKVVADEQLPII